MLLPTIVFALQEMVEESLLQLYTVIGIKFCPVFETVSFQPLIVGRGPHESFKVSTRVQSLATPVGCGQYGCRYLRPDGGAYLVVVIIEWVRKNIVTKITTIVLECVIGQRLRATNRCNTV